MHYLIESPTPKTSFNCGLKTETYKLMSVPQAATLLMEDII